MYFQDNEQKTIQFSKKGFGDAFSMYFFHFVKSSLFINMFPYFLGAIGGIIGFTIGASAISCLEIFGLLFYLCYLIFSNLRKENDTNIKEKH